MTDDNDNRADKEKREIVDADDLISSMGVGHTVDFQRIAPVSPGESLTANPIEEQEPASQAEPPLKAPKKPQQTSQKLAQLIQKDPGENRRVPKTMLDPPASKNQDKAQQQEISPAAPLIMPKSKVPKTKLFKDDAPKGKKAKREEVPVAKTLLDHNVIIENQLRSGERQKERLEQEISKRQLEPTKIIEPIQAKKKASSSCPFSWSEGNAKERFKYCSTCQANIYNFDGLEQEEAEALVFKRENREKFVLYGRADGKFMTSDCPAAVNKRNKTIVLVSACVGAIALIGAMFILMPKPTHDPTADAPQAAPPDTVLSDSEDSDAKSSKSAKSGKSSQSNDGAAYHYHDGDAMPTVAPKEDTSNQPSASYSDSEQSGDFWQYDSNSK